MSATKSRSPYFYSPLKV
jgi:hypothetical protein